MAISLPNGRNYFANSQGAPLAGGKVYAYQPGTSTPKDTYTTSAASVANANPVILDARGEAAIYWVGDYDVVLKDSAGSTIWGPERLQSWESGFTATGNITAAAFIPSGSTVPANGVYLPAANTLGLASNTTLRWSVNSTGAHTFAAPSSGVPVTFTAVSSAGSFTNNISDIQCLKIDGNVANSNERALAFASGGGGGAAIGFYRDGSWGTGLRFYTNLTSNATSGGATLRMSISDAGNVTIAAPSSGITATLTPVSGGVPLKLGTLTVANLLAAATAGAGAKAFVTDATATTFASVVAGGGSNGVPVYSDGTNWRIG